MQLNNKNCYTFFVSLSFLVMPLKLHANEIHTSGFGTVGMAIGDNKVPYLTGKEIRDEPNFLSDTLIGLQFTGEANNSFEYFIQIVAKDRVNHFAANIDWLVASFRVSDSISLRGGKLRIPYFLYSKHVDVGNIYPWARPPSEVYDLIEFTSYVGIDSIFRINISGSELVVRPILGQISDELNRASIPGGPAEVFTEESFGLSLELNYELLKAHISTFRADATLSPNPAFTDTLSTITALSPSPLPLPSSFDTNTYVDIIAIGLRYEIDDYLFISEIAQRNIDPQIISNLLAYYITFGKKFDDILLHLTFAVLESKETPTGTFSSGGGQEQQSTTLGVKYQLMQKGALHLNVQNVNPQNGTQGLFSSNQDTSTIVTSTFSWVF